MTESYVPVVYKFSGAGNDFVVLDGRQGGMEAFRQKDRIGALCRQYGTDGLMILTLDPSADFAMEFYNPDGSGGMMCGNGGRCIVAFADYLGLRPAAPDGTWLFRAPDGMHTASILSFPEGGDISGTVATLGPIRGRGPSERMGGVAKRRSGDISPLRKWIVRLKMIDVKGITPVKGGYFLNTGTRHFVQLVQDVYASDMERDAQPLRWDPAFQPEGANVNLVQVTPEGLKVRTFEKGVEGETLACGTGLTASAIAAYVAGVPAGAGSEAGKSAYNLQCRRGDWLQVDFRPDDAGGFTDVYLTGPAERVQIG